MQGKPRWFCLEILPRSSPAAEGKRERAAAPPPRTNSSLPLTATNLPPAGSRGFKGDVAAAGHRAPPGWNKDVSFEGAGKAETLRNGPVTARAQLTHYPATSLYGSACLSCAHGRCCSTHLFTQSSTNLIN